MSTFRRNILSPSSGLKMGRYVTSRLVQVT
jgi:hypothetical protein